MNATDFRAKTISGIGWSLFSQVGRQGFQLIIAIILARLLSPREFGLLSMVVIFTNFASIFSEMGFGASLIQKKEINENQLSSVFWFNVIAGLILTILFIICSPLIANYYQEPILIPVTIVLSFNTLFSSFSIIQNTLLVKQMDFKKLSFVEITSLGISGSIAIIMAFYGFGVWGLVAQSITLTIVTVILLWLLIRWRPKLLFEWAHIKSLLGFSTNLLGTNLLNYWARNIDYVLVGRYLGSDPLGIYHRAYDVMLFPLSNISRVISRVMFPSFSTIQDDKKRIKEIFLKASRVIALITFPAMMGLFITVDKFVRVVFGSNWLEMIPVLQILCLVGMVQSIQTLNGNLYLSQGRADVQFKLGTALRILAIIGIIIGLNWGIVGVAAFYAITSIISVYPSFYFAGKLVDLTFVEAIKNLTSIFFCSAGMAIFIYLVGKLIPQNYSPLVHLIAQAAFGVLFYGLMIHFFKVNAYIEVKRLFYQQRKNI